MRNLLDTHTIIWLAVDSPALSRAAKQAIFCSDNKSFVSIASAWEVALKISKGKLRLDGGVSEFFNIVDKNGFGVLPITKEHIIRVESLPFFHRDPFDRILVASAMVEKMCLITADVNIRLYDVVNLW